jgi:hypothetical protein
MIAHPKSGVLAIGAPESSDGSAKTPTPALVGIPLSMLLVPSHRLVRIVAAGFLVLRRITAGCKQPQT